MFLGGFVNLYRYSERKFRVRKEFSRLRGSSEMVLSGSEYREYRGDILITFLYFRFLR